MTNLADPDQIRREIEISRQELGDALEALAAKTNVKRRLKEKLSPRVKAVVIAGSAVMLMWLASRAAGSVRTAARAAPRGQRRPAEVL
jgi:exopolyphosphatase/pppGpp-phosphohydrolase